MAAPLRTGEPAVVGRTENRRLVLALRCVEPAQDNSVRDAILRAAAPG